MARAQIGQRDLEQALPDLQGTLTLKGLEGTVHVVRDKYGIPHVRAQSIHDAFFAQGFVTAQDRLWQMDYDRHRAYGRWAEYAGKAGLEQDKLMRRFRLLASARADYEEVGVRARVMLDAYAAGVNAFIQSTKTLPIEYTILGTEPEPWQPWDCLAVYKVRHILMGLLETKVWRAKLLNHLGPEKTAMLYPGYTPGHLLILPPGATYQGQGADGLDILVQGVFWVKWLKETLLEEEEGGSNNWVLAGSRTASGKPLVAGDPHRPLDTPNVYYQNHIACPQFDVVGLSFAGMPGFPHFGHNRDVAWCVTHTGADYQDLYVELFKEGESYLYASQGSWKQAEVYHETINVRGGEPVKTEVVVTHHGPIVLGGPSVGFGAALKYTATAQPGRWPEAVFNMLLATSTDELEEAMRLWVDPVNNFIFADVHGNIGYRTRGQVPVRHRANAWLPVPGWTGEYEWQGMVPFEEMPHAKNPEEGYIVTANNRVVGHEYPHYIALDFSPEFRARRLVKRIQSLERATVQDMVSLHADRVSVPARRFLELLPKIQPLNVRCTRARDKLLEWDGSMEAGRTEPTIFSAFFDNLAKRVLEPFFGPLFHEAFAGTGRGGPAHFRRLKTLILDMVEKDDRSLLPEGSDWNTLMAQALADAVSQLTEKLGENMETWLWGKLHRTKPQHPLSPSFPHLAKLLDPPSVAMGGDDHTPQAASYSPARPFTITSTSVARYVFDLSDWDNSAWITPLGASGHPGSPHYSDQSGIWSQVQLIPMLYDWGKIEAQAETTQTLSAQD